MSFDATNPITPALNPGDQLGYFDVQSPLAAGGMSLVWKGYDRVLDRHVAIKQVAGAEDVDEEIRQKFNQEAELQKKVSSSHKNIVDVIDLIDDPRGLFIVTEYIDGSSLDRALAKLDGPMDPRQSLGIMHQITLGLSAIQNAGVLHRDLKPSNILLPREGGVKIGDFGLATLQAEQETLTVGTARYMAPELFTGTQADARADLYSLGMIAYEMLAGRPAFEETFKTVMRDQRNQALRWMKWHTNPRLTAPPLTKLNPDVPAELSDMIARLMAKDPTQRIASTPQLLEVIKRTFSGAPRSSPPPIADDAGPAATAEPTAPLPKRSRLPLILGTILLAQALLIGGVVGYFELRKTQQTQQVRAAALDEFDQARRLYAEEQQYAQAGRIFSRLADAWPDDPALGPPSLARAFICKARVLMAQGQSATAEFEFDRAETLYEQALDALEQANATVPNLRDHVNQIAGEVEFRKAFVDVAGKVVEQIRAGDYNAARHSIRVFREKAQPVDMEDQILQQLAARIEDQSTQTQINDVLARIRQLESDGQFAEALSVTREARQRYTSAALNDREKELARQLQYDDLLAQARAAENRGDLAGAVGLYQQVNDIQPSDQLRDKITELQRRQSYQRGRDAEMAGNFEDAKRQYNNALPLPEAKEALSRLGQVVNKNSLVQAGDTAMAAGNYDSAQQLYRQAMDIEADARTQSKWNEATVRMNAERARDALDAGDLAAAQRHIDAALAIDPTDVQANRAAEDLAVLREYHQHLQEGDEARRVSDFGRATEAYLQARQTLRGTGVDMTEIEQRLEDTEYDSWIAKAKAAIEARQWRLARAHLSSAENVRRRTTDQIQRLRQEIDAHAPDSDS